MKNVNSSDQSTQFADFANSFAEKIRENDATFDARAHNIALLAMAAWKKVDVEMIAIALEAGAPNVVEKYKHFLAATIDILLEPIMSPILTAIDEKATAKALH